MNGLKILAVALLLAARSALGASGADVKAQIAPHVVRTKTAGVDLVA